MAGRFELMAAAVPVRRPGGSWRTKARFLGGKRGYLVGVAPQDIVSVLRPTLVEVGISDA